VPLLPWQAVSRAERPGTTSYRLKPVNRQVRKTGDAVDTKQHAAGSLCIDLPDFPVRPIPRPVDSQNVLWSAGRQKISRNLARWPQRRARGSWPASASLPCMAAANKYHGSFGKKNLISLSGS
jgi:hypothetical protein